MLRCLANITWGIFQVLQARMMWDRSSCFDCLSDLSAYNSCVLYTLFFTYGIYTQREHIRLFDTHGSNFLTRGILNLDMGALTLHICNIFLLLWKKINNFLHKVVCKYLDHISNRLACKYFWLTCYSPRILPRIEVCRELGLG